MKNFLSLIALESFDVWLSDSAVDISDDSGVSAVADTPLFDTWVFSTLLPWS